jgi:O-acetyl-ADP-ribose deacetylase
MTTSADLGGVRVECLAADITRLDPPVDAIVNAANSALAGGGGVDGAIHRAAGPALMAELRERYGEDRHCPTGSAVVTGAGALDARWVIHAVGPVWHGGERGEADLLASAYRTSLDLAAEQGARSVAFPAISCGVYGYPLDAAAGVAMAAVRDWIAAHVGSGVERIVFALRGEDALTAFGRALREVAGSAADPS